MAMASKDRNQPHFILIPLMAQGHLIPMIDMARLFAKHGVSVTLITTPLNASRFESVIGRAIKSGLSIQLVQLHFPCVEVGLPEGCENFDLVPSPDLTVNFFAALELLRHPVEEFLKEQHPLPSCIISDMCLPWTSETALKLGIPRIVFHGPSCFSLLCMTNVFRYKVRESVASDSEPFVIPDLPHAVEITKAQLPGHWMGSDLQRLGVNVRESELYNYGVVINSFDELEPEYIEKFRKAIGKKVWCIGPVSLCNKEMLDQAERGSKASFEKSQCLNWLDSQKPNSVVYVCFGSISRLSLSHMIEIGLGLEASGQPFIWVIKESGEDLSELERWLSEGFEERVKERGLIIRGWAPQLLILSHPSTGGFLTHCGWNSTLEGISSGLPLIVCPLFAEQFLNAKLVVEVLRIGVNLIAAARANLGNAKEVEVLVRMDEVKKAVEMLMDEGEEGKERRKRAAEFGVKARRAMEEGGSSCTSMALMIEDVQNQGLARLLRTHFKK